ncbi:MAG: hypothetical protein IKV87_01715 [Methanobrevibacter sp.]|nr:hypothetical protein [Methanobrevibacter sp.]
MSFEPILVIKDTDSTIGIRARVGEEFFEHEIQLNVMLAYYWDNGLPVIESLIDLFESSVKRTVNEVIPHESLYLKYNLITDDEVEKATRFEIHLLEVKADDVALRLDGKILALKGLGSKEEYSKGFSNGKIKKEEDLIFNDSKKTQLVEKNIPTMNKISFKEFAKQQRMKEKSK